MLGVLGILYWPSGHGMWKKGKSERVKGDSKLILFSLKHGTPEKMELPYKETDCTGGQSCSGAKGRIGVWIGWHHATIAFTPLIADTEGGNSLGNINFIVARKKIVYEARHWMQWLRCAKKR